VLFDAIRAHAAIVSPAKMHAVRRLMASRAFSIAFQPIWNLSSQSVLGYEALMRPAPETGLVGPQEVFDIAEKLGRAAELDQMCLATILEHAGSLPPETLLFVNLSPQSLDAGAFRDAALSRAVGDSGLEPRRIVFEITERSVGRMDMVVREGKRLKSLGFRLALDDVGAGNAGLDMLRQITIDFVKIDRAVIAQALIDESAAAVLAGIIAFARHARTFVIAEGVETQPMLEIVNRAGQRDPSVDGGVQGVQGFLFGRPSEVIPRTLSEADGLVVSYDEFRSRHAAPTPAGEADSSHTA
jgi:EAL domain-containing protein (putative c-di-GMP-specific phosphodiesterase class I)